MAGSSGAGESEAGASGGPEYAGMGTLDCSVDIEAVVGGCSDELYKIAWCPLGPVIGIGDL